jgi:hypothetical protein
MNAESENEFYKNDRYIIAVAGVGEDTNIRFNIRTGDDLRDFGPGVEIEIGDVDRFVNDLKRLKDAAVKRLDGGVPFIAA